MIEFKEEFKERINKAKDLKERAQVALDFVREREGKEIEKIEKRELIWTDFTFAEYARFAMKKIEELEELEKKEAEKAEKLYSLKCFYCKEPVQETDMIFCDSACLEEYEDIE